MKRIAMFILLVAISMGSLAGAYDAKLAKSYEKLFSQVKGAGAGKALHLISPAAFVDGVQKGKKFVALDVRTVGETGIFGMTLPGSIVIPANQVFTKANLAKLPTNKTIVVICKAGARSVAIATALRHIGFDKVYILKGGMMGLSGFLGPKQGAKKK